LSTGTWTVGRSVLFTGVALAAALLVDQIVGCMSASGQMRDSHAAATIAGGAVLATADDLIVQMAQSAGVIFVGEVVDVRRPGTGFSGSPEAAAEGVVEVDFFVDQTVRGPAPGSTYTLREWGGLWVAGTGRYRVGQRLLLLLHAPDANGLSSPVHGAEGLIPLRGGGQPPGPEDESSTVSQWVVDVRWLQAQTLQTQVRLGAPARVPAPVRGGRDPHSEALISIPLSVPQIGNLLLVHPLPGPWIEQESFTVPAEPLLHVLSLCVNSVRPQDASR
jgi:hypothetical protein